ncbi:E3 SUMO-protein ligase ZBED1-like [Simochromis diagramma]|uniref:E3 SUMO-protein ligase ZBED1-like n=1 Tax=Simochromis diagramma TaxID=43689 RepID=UPI001A7EE21F|nr:E3 SUMO-protein ligase ZBED1-like [Simochromis diagramma]
MEKDGPLGGKFYFKKLPNGVLDKTRVTCTICEAEFRYHRSNSSLGYHLRAKHPAESQDHRGLKTEEVSEKLTSALVVWIAKSCRPASMVEDDGLKEVLRAASGDMCYNPPSTETIVSRLRAVYEDHRAQRHTTLLGAMNVALTGDHWTSVDSDNYCAVTAHFIDNDWALQSFALAVSETEERHYADHFLSVANEWKIGDKLTTLGTDSAWLYGNMVDVASLLPFEHMPCTAHILHSAITVSLNDSGFERVLAKCREIVGHFEDSPAKAQELNAQQAAHGHDTEALVQDAQTRWNSTLEMIKQIQRNKSVLTSILAQQNSTVTMLTEQELDRLQKLEELLEPCRYVTELLGGERYVSCSMVLPALRHLFWVMERLDDDPVYVVKFKMVFTTDLAQRRASSNLTWLKIATALDPRFKDLKCLPKDERREVWTLVHDLLMAETQAQQPSVQIKEEPSPKKSKMSIFLLGSSDSDTEEEEDSIGRCLDRYKAEPKAGAGACPLQWWSKREGAHARLASIARKYLSTPATTVPCESLFSLSGDVTEKKRASLSSEEVNRIVCLSNWLSAQKD